MINISIDENDFDQLNSKEGLCNLDHAALEL